MQNQRHGRIHHRLVIDGKSGREQATQGERAGRWLLGVDPLHGNERKKAAAAAVNAALGGTFPGTVNEKKNLQGRWCPRDLVTVLARQNEKHRVEGT